MEAVYKGNIYINGNTIVLAITGALYLWLLIFIRTTLVSVTIFTAGWLYIFLKQSLQVYYYLLNDENLTIKNHYLPWIEVTVPLEEIKELSFEKRFRMANSLLVTTKSYSTHYCGSSLTAKDWLNLNSDLAKKNITIRNKYTT